MQKVGHMVSAAGRCEYSVSKLVEMVKNGSDKFSDLEKTYIKEADLVVSDGRQLSVQICRLMIGMYQKKSMAGVIVSKKKKRR